MLTRDEALKICEAVLAHARSAGADDAVVTLDHSTESHARFAENRITTSGRADDMSVTVTVWVERRRGSVTTNATDAAALRHVAEEAVQIARISPVHREYVPTLGPQTYAEARNFAAATADIDVVARATTLGRVLRTCSARGVVGAGFHMAVARATATATANGNRRYFPSSLASFRVTARTPDGTGSGYAGGDHVDAATLDVERLAERAVDKAVRSREPRPIEPQTYPVILEPQAVADLIGFLMGAFDARTADEGRSAFSASGGRTRVGETLFSDRLMIYSDPMHPDLPVTPCTNEGIPATRVPLVTRGVLETLETTRYWGESKKRAPTPGPVNAIVESAGPTSSLDEMIKATDRGLLVSRFWYVRMVDPRTIVLTGLTRDGLWWIDKGRISHPVRNLRFNQSVLAMLAGHNVQAIGVPERHGYALVPALKLSDFTFTSVSDAI